MTVAHEVTVHLQAHKRVVFRDYSRKSLSTVVNLSYYNVGPIIYYSFAGKL